MSGLRLREPAVGLLLGRVDNIRELDGILDEEDRDVIAYQIPVALLRVELDGEAAHIARQIGRALVTRHRGEPDERRRPRRPREQVGPGEIGQRLVVLEVPVRPVAAGVHHPFRDPLVVEVEDLLAEVEVLQRAGTAFADPQGVLVIGDHGALLGGQPLAVPGYLVSLATQASLDLLIAVYHRQAVVLVPGRHGALLGRHALWSRTALPASAALIPLGLVEGNQSGRSLLGLRAHDGNRAHGWIAAHCAGSLTW